MSLYGPDRQQGQLRAGSQPLDLGVGHPLQVVERGSLVAFAHHLGAPIIGRVFAAWLVVSPTDDPSAEQRRSLVFRGIIPWILPLPQPGVRKDLNGRKGLWSVVSSTRVDRS